MAETARFERSPISQRNDPWPAGPPKLATLFLLWALFPGSGEAVENALHLLTEGHFAHGVESRPAEEDHTPLGQEGHCCHGPFHFCLCHRTQASSPAVPPPTLSALPVVARPAVRRPPALRRGHSSPPDHPPPS